MSSTAPFEVLVRRQPGYELLLTLRFSVDKHAGVLSLSRTGWHDDEPAYSSEITDVLPTELRGGRFTVVLEGSRRREGYSLARVSEDLLSRLGTEQWTALEPVTEFGFRYLQLPEDAVSATPASASVRTKIPAVAAAPASAVSRPADTSTLLSRARHSSASAAVHAAQSAQRVAPAAASALAQVRLSDTGEIEVHSAPSLPPKPRPVASAASSGTQAPRRSHHPGGLPGAMPARPVPVEASLAMAALEGLLPQELRERLRLEMIKVQDLHLRLGETERRLIDSQDRERDLLSVLQKWQDRRLQ